VIEALIIIGNFSYR